MYRRLSPHSSNLLFVVLHIVPALAIQLTNDIDDMEAFQKKITQYFQNVASATWPIDPQNQALYDSLKVAIANILTGILFPWLSFSSH